MVLDKLKRGGVSSEETGSAILGREHMIHSLSFGIVQSLCHPLSIVGLWCQGKLIVIDNESFHFNCN